MDENIIPQNEQTETVEPIKIEPPKKKKRRRRRRGVRYAAPLGFLVLFFALVGVISSIVFSVQLVQKLSDDTALRHELTLFLDPVMQLCPSAFEDAGDAEEQETLVMAAIYDIAETERIRQLREKDENFRYEQEETQGRMIVPQADVEAAFAALFGEETIRQHATVGEAEYVADKQCYYVPLNLNTSGMIPVLDIVRKSGSTYRVRIAYVANADVQIDERGNPIEPTADMGTYTQWFTVKRNKDRSLTLVSVTAEEQLKK